LLFLLQSLRTQNVIKHAIDKSKQWSGPKIEHHHMKAMLYKILYNVQSNWKQTHSPTGLKKVRIKFEFYKRNSNLEKTNLTSLVTAHTWLSLVSEQQLMICSCSVIAAQAQIINCCTPRIPGNDETINWIRRLSSKHKTVHNNTYVTLRTDKTSHVFNNANDTDTDSLAEVNLFPYVYQRNFLNPHQTTISTIINILLRISMPGLPEVLQLTYGRIR